MSLDKELIEALNQLKTITWDGDLISKYKRDLLGVNGLAGRTKDGWNFITREGIDVLVKEDGLWPKNNNRAIDTLTGDEIIGLAKALYQDSYEPYVETIVHQYQCSSAVEFVTKLGKCNGDFETFKRVYMYLKSIGVSL